MEKNKLFKIQQLYEIEIVIIMFKYHNQVLPTAMGTKPGGHVPPTFSPVRDANACPP